MIALLLPALALFAADLPAPEPLDDAVSVYRSLPFAASGAGTLLLDLYVPATPPEPVPCIVVIPGEFRRRSRTDSGTARRFAEAGFAAASIGYRGWPEHPFPAAVHDTKAAVRFLRAKAGLLSIDPARIGAFGQSAGGHLAAMLAVSDHPDLEGDGGNAGVSSRVQAAVTYAGVFDFIERFRETNAIENNPETAHERRLDRRALLPGKRGLASGLALLPRVHGRRADAARALQG